MKTQLTTVGAALMSMLNAMQLEVGRQDTLYVRHVDSQEACNAFNTFDSEKLYKFNQEACACFYDPELMEDEMAECPGDIHDPMIADRCAMQCQI